MSENLKIYFFRITYTTALKKVCVLSTGNNVHMLLNNYNLW